MATVLTLDQIITSAQESKGDVKNNALKVQSQARGLAGEQAFTLTGDSLKNLQDQLNNQRRTAGAIASIIQNLPDLATILAYIIAQGFRRSFTTQVDLVTGVNTISYADPDNEGDRLAIWVRQNSAGDGTVTFDTNILFCDANYVTNTADSVVLWDCVAFPDPDDSNTLKWFGVAPANAEQLL